MTSSAASSVTSRNFDFIVVGVGGMGSATCFHLARRGFRVLGLEQFHLAHDRGSSHGETRIVRRAYFEHSNYIPLLMRAYELWDALELESNEKLFVRNGLVLFGDPEKSVVYQGTVASAEKYSIGIEKLNHREALRRFPLFRPMEGLAAVYEPDAGFVHVERVVRTHAELAQKYGAEIHENEPVLSYEASESGVRVKTNQGEYSAAKLVITGGGWNVRLLQDLKVPLKLQRVIQTWFKATGEHRLDPVAPCFAFHQEDEFYYGFPMLDRKTVKIGAHFTREDIHDPAEKDISEMPPSALGRLQDFIQKSLPQVKPELDRYVPCLYTMTPDEHFILDLHPAHKNISFAAGFSGHGFKFSPVIGEIMADLAMDGSTRHPIDFLRRR